MCKFVVQYTCCFDDNLSSISLVIMGVVLVWCEGVTTVKARMRQRFVILSVDLLPCQYRISAIASFTTE